jgi:hypothetical protein
LWAGRAGFTIQNSQGSMDVSGLLPGVYFFQFWDDYPRRSEWVGVGRCCANRTAVLNPLQHGRSVLRLY